MPFNLDIRLLRTSGRVINFSMLLILSSSTCSFREKPFIFVSRLWMITVMLMFIIGKVVEERAAAAWIVDVVGRMLSVVAPIEDHVELMWLQPSQYIVLWTLSLCIHWCAWPFLMQGQFVVGPLADNWYCVPLSLFWTVCFVRVSELRNVKSEQQAGKSV